MEIVSNKLRVSAEESLEGPQRSLERKETFSSPRKWNSSTQLRQSHRRRESLSLSNNSLLSLKAYYRKLRTFKGTIKALISFRRLPTFVSRTGSMTDASTGLEVQVEGDESGDSTKAAPKVTEAVMKLTDDKQALDRVQSQVKDLVEKGHVVTEHEEDDVTYRLQGNLEHYTEENLRKRLKLQEHPHMVALTQRLWLAAVHEKEDYLTFGEYEAYMLRLHRLILPEFDLAQAKSLIKDDWTRDTDGSDRLDYRFFHFSMFELVDLWTDTIEAEDYISLLYCIMHSLTFDWNGRHLLKDLEDINPVDILQASKDASMEEIERDLAREVNGDSAQMYRDRIACDDAVLSEEEDANDWKNEESTSSEPLHDRNAGAESPVVNVVRDLANNASNVKIDPPPQIGRRKVSQTPSSPSKASLERKSSRIGGYPVTSRSSVARAQDAASARLSSLVSPAESTSFHNSVKYASTMAADGTSRALITEDANGAGNTVTQLSHFGLDLHGQRQGPVIGARPGNNHAGSRHIYSPAGTFQYSSYTDSETGPISIVSLGASGEYLNMVSRPSYVRKPSAMGGGPISRQSGSSYVDQAVLGQGLQPGQESHSAYRGENRAASSGNAATDVAPLEGVIIPISRSTFVAPRSPQFPRQSAKENELRDSLLLVSGDSSRSPSAGDGKRGSTSMRVKSARSQSRASQQGSQFSVQLQSTGPNRKLDTAGNANTPPLSVFPLDGHRLAIDPQSLVVGGPMSPRMSILSRPATSSPSSRATFLEEPGGLEGFLQARAYKEVSTTHVNSPRTASRGSRLHQPRTSQALPEALAISAVGMQAHTLLPTSPSPRSTAIHATSSSPHAFAGSVVGSGRLSVETFQQNRLPGSRSSTAKIGYLQGISRRPEDATSLSADMELSGLPARLSIHKEAVSPRSTRVVR